MIGLKSLVAGIALLSIAGISSAKADVLQPHDDLETTSSLLVVQPFSADRVSQELPWQLNTLALNDLGVITSPIVLAQNVDLFPESVGYQPCVFEGFICADGFWSDPSNAYVCHQIISSEPRFSNIGDVPKVPNSDGNLEQYETPPLADVTRN